MYLSIGLSSYSCNINFIIFATNISIIFFNFLNFLQDMYNEPVRKLILYLIKHEKNYTFCTSFS